MVPSVDIRARENAVDSNNLYSIIKFIAGSGFGIFMFLCPLNGADEPFATGLSLMTDLVDNAVRDNVPWLLFLVVMISSIGSLVGKVFKPDFIMKNEIAKGVFDVSYPYMITRLVAMIITACVFMEMGPEVLRSEDVGAGMISLSQTLIAIAVVFSFILPFLTDCGIMEFCGIILKPLIRPLFHVPGRASIDLIASWLASSNTSVILTSGQYEKGFYSRREAASIMTNFSLVSIPFCMVVAETLGVSECFLLLYGAVTVIGIILAFIGVRIWPLGNIPDEYNGKKTINEDVPENTSLMNWAFSEAIDRADKFTLANVFHGGIKMTIGILMDLIPIVIAWGSIGTLLVNETELFHLMSYPMGAYMAFLGIPCAYEIAPATLVGFIDMFIPALITSPDMPFVTRFTIAVLSLVQIIYLTEVGSIIVKSGVGLNLGKLFVIFIERTLIALPLIALTAKLFL